MAENDIDKIENDIKKIFREGTLRLESIKTNDIKRKPEFIKGFVRKLELQIKIMRLKLKTLEYKTKNQQMKTVQK